MISYSYEIRIDRIAVRRSALVRAWRGCAKIGSESNHSGGQSLSQVNEMSVWPLQEVNSAHQHHSVTVVRGNDFAILVVDHRHALPTESIDTDQPIISHFRPSTKLSHCRASELPRLLVFTFSTRQ